MSVFSPVRKGETGAIVGADGIFCPRLIKYTMSKSIIITRVSINFGNRIDRIPSHIIYMKNLMMLDPRDFVI